MALPSSRKKYYLQATIKPEWTDEEFLPEFVKHIESNSNKSLRDIFISNSSRMGTFSVKTKPIAEKLLASFSTNNISCRGRKPQAEIIPVTPTNFQIKLRNLNNVITSTEFISWILSLHYDSFDIKLYPLRIYKGSNKCILSFNTIDTAIHVKNKVQNSVFRGTKLYFTHWHVPRRNINNIHNIKIGVVLGLVDNTSMNSTCTPNSGYSTCTPIKSTTATPIKQFDIVANTTTPFDVAGPLYLRDSTIPPPPIRQPPHPPINEYEISFEEEIISNEANKMYLNQLENELEKQKLMISQLLTELENQKQMASLYYNKYVSLLNINKILLWSSKDVYNWITSLEKGLFIKYKEYLMYSINNENINGSMLSKLNTKDLQRLGVTDVNHIYLLLNHIHKLFSS